MRLALRGRQWLLRLPFLTADVFQTAGYDEENAITNMGGFVAGVSAAGWDVPPVSR